MPQFIKNKQIEDEFNDSMEFIEKDWSLYTEKLLLDIREIIAERMNQKIISRAELAKTLGCSRSYVTQVLDGSANIRLGTLVKILFSLGIKPYIKYEYQDFEIYKNFEKGKNLKLNFKESIITTIIVENKVSQKEYEPA